MISKWSKKQLWLNVRKMILKKHLWGRFEDFTHGRLSVDQPLPCLQLIFETEIIWHLLSTANTTNKIFFSWSSRILLRKTPTPPLSAERTQLTQKLNRKWENVYVSVAEDNVPALAGPLLFFVFLKKCVWHLHARVTKPLLRWKFPMCYVMFRLLSSAVCRLWTVQPTRSSMTF